MEAPFTIKAIATEKRTSLVVTMPSDIRDGPWAADYGEALHEIYYNTEPHITGLQFDLQQCEWADPLPLLSFGLTLAYHRSRGEHYSSKLLLSLKNKRFLKFVAQEGFMRTMLSNNIAIEVDGVEIDGKRIKEYENISINLAYVNSTCIPAEIIDVSHGMASIEKWVDERIAVPMVKTESLVHVRAGEELFYKLGALLKECISNVATHAYPSDKLHLFGVPTSKKFLGIYARFREGLIGKAGKESLDLREAIKNEGSEDKYPKLDSSYLTVRKGCIEVFVLDQGVGIVSTMKDVIKGPNYQQYNSQFGAACVAAFADGERGTQNKSSSPTRHGGLHLIHRLLSDNKDYIRGLDDNYWFGAQVPMPKSEDADNDTTVSKKRVGRLIHENSSKARREDRIKKYFLPGLHWHMRLSWHKDSDTTDKDYWIHWEGNLEDNPLLGAFLGTFANSRPANSIVIDNRFPPFGAEKITKQKNVHSILIFLEKGLSKNQISMAIEKAMKEIPVADGAMIFIADIPQYECSTYIEAFSNGSFEITKYSKLRLASRIVLLSKRCDVACFKKSQNNAKLFSFESKLNEAASFCDNTSGMGKDEPTSTAELLMWIRFHDSYIFWKYIGRNRRKFLYLADNVKWKKDKYLKGYLDFTKILSEPFIYDLFCNALERIIGLSQKKIIKLEPLDILVKGLIYEFNSRHSGSNASERVEIGSVLVSGSTMKSASLLKKETLCIHFFNHLDSKSFQAVAEAPHYALFLWPTDEKFLQEMDATNIQPPLERVGSTPIVAPGGWKYFQLHRFDDNNQSCYAYGPRETYELIQRANPELFRAGHWYYESHHDFFTTNIMLALRLSFLDKHDLAIFLVANIFKALDVKKDELNKTGLEWLELTNKTGQAEHTLHRHVFEKKYSLVVYPSHPTTIFVIQKIKSFFLDSDKADMSEALKNRIAEKLGRLTSIFPMRNRRGSASMIFPPLTLLEIEKKLDNDSDILYFDDALVTGRTQRDLEGTLLSLNLVRSVDHLCIIDRRRLPGKVLDTDKFKIFMRLDIPPLGDSETCPMCKSLSILNAFAKHLTNRVQEVISNNWFEEWKCMSPMINWKDHGLPFRYYQSSKQTKDFPIRFSTNGKYEVLDEIPMFSNIGLLTYVTELSTMTSRDDLAQKYCNKEPQPEDQAKIALLCSQMLLFRNVIDNSLLLDNLTLLLALLCKQENRSNYTSLAVITLMNQDIAVLRNIAKSIDDDIVGNDDAVIFYAYLLWSGVIKKVEDCPRQLGMRAARIILDKSKNELEQFDAFHNEILTKTGVLHARPLPKFLAESLEKLSDRVIWDVLDSLDKLKYILERLDQNLLRTEDTKYEQLRKSFEEKAEKIKDDLRQNLNGELVDVVDAKKQAEKLLNGILKKIHEMIFLALDVDRGYTSQIEKRINLCYERIAWKDLLPGVSSKPTIKFSRTGKPFPDPNMKKVWCLWDRMVEKEGVEHLVGNAGKNCCTKEIGDPWGEVTGKAHIWIQIEYFKRHLTVRFANYSETPSDTIKKELKRTCYYSYSNAELGVVNYKNLNETVVCGEIDLPYAGFLNSFSRRSNG